MERRLPEGRLTLLFSDIEGSTRLLHRLGPAYAALLAEKRALFRAAIDAHGGVEVDTQGDAFFVVFPDAVGAVDAATAVHRALAAHAWPEGVAVRVRIGLHSGSPARGDDGYVGLELHQGARICAAAHGGQTLVSELTRRLVEGHGGAWKLRSLGRFRLKDIPEPEPLHQVVAPDLPAEFPPPRTIDARPNNLPAETTEFVGRQRELRHVQEQLRAHRLVNLLGPGGTGKTRIALAAARALLGDFADGVFLVRLDALDDAAQVAPAIAQVLGVREDGEGALSQRLAEALRGKTLLLLLDNFEHVLGAGPLVSTLLARAPGLKVLATSQAVLRCSGEAIVAIPPLGLPPPVGRSAAAELLAADSVELFVRRARAADAGFVVTEDNVGDIARIVTRLEGNALAIELAAARVRLFPPSKLLPRLEDRFRVLSGGGADGPQRHRTLLDLVAWSYGLLPPAEQALLRRLSVFRGGFTLDAAESVAGGGAVDDVLQGVESLLDKSLLRREEKSADVRLSLLDTIREFAERELCRNGEDDRLQRLHAAHFLTVVTAAEPGFTRAGQREIQALLAEDDHNLRTALDTLRQRGPLDEALALASASWRYWHAMGRLDEGRETIGALLTADGASALARARAESALGGLAYWQADYGAARAAYERALAAFEALGEAELAAETLFALSTTCTWSGSGEEGARFADRALAAFRALGHREGIGRVRMAAGFARWMAGDLDGARPLWEESLAIAREVGDAVEAATKTVALAALRFQQGERTAPVALCVGALVELVERHNLSHVVMALDFAGALLAHRDPLAGCRLAGAAESLRAVLGGGMRPESCQLLPARRVAEQALGAAAADQAFAEGLALRLDEAVRLARSAAAEARAARDGHENDGFLSWEHGFLPARPPLLGFPPGSAWEAWDGLVEALPALYRDLGVRGAMAALPVLDAEALPAEALLRAACVVGIGAHAWTRCEPEPAPLPPCIALPWAGIARRLGRPYAYLNYLELILYNWRLRRPDGPRSVANMDLLVPTVGTPEERVFYLTQVEILARGAEVLRQVCAALEAVEQDAPEAFAAACDRVVGVLQRVVDDALLQIDPNPRSRTHVDPVVWARTVAPLAVPLQPGLPGPSGTQSPLFHLLDVWLGRSAHQSTLGRESLHIRDIQPPNWRALLAAVGAAPTAGFVARWDRPDVRQAWSAVREAYAGPSGFLGRHRLKVYGYLDIAFKVGRSTSISGYRGLFRDRMWEHVDRELDDARVEREPGRGSAPLRVQVARVSARSEGIVAVELDVDGQHARVQPGDRCAIHPENDAARVDRMLGVLEATGEEAVSLNSAWRAALEALGLDPVPALSLRELLRFGALRPVSREVARRLARVSGSEELAALVEARGEEGMELWELLALASRQGWSPRRLVRAEPGEAEHLLRFVPPLAPRLYSVAGWTARADGAAASLRLLVGQLRYQTPRGPRTGTASAWLCDPANGGRVLAARLVHPVRFGLPAEGSLPIAMFAAGSGLAPFLSFLQARAGRLGEPDLLFLGAREPGLVPPEAPALRVWAAGGGGTRLEELLRGRVARAALEALLGAGGHLYLCGRAGFARGILEALGEVLGEEALWALFAAGRMHLEVFTTHTERRELPPVETSALVEANRPQGRSWVAIGGRVFDVGAFQHWHPGGARLVQAYLGMDASAVYERVGHDRAPEVHALLDLFAVGAIRRLDLGPGLAVELAPEGLRTIPARAWFRRWVRLAYTLVEIENAFALDRGFAARPTSAADVPGEPSRQQLGLAADGIGRFYVNVHEGLLAEPLDAVWAATVAFGAPQQDVRALRREIAAVRATPEAQAVEAAPGLARARAYAEELPLQPWLAWVEAVGERQARTLGRLKEVLREGLLCFERHEARTGEACGPAMVALLQTIPGILREHVEEVAPCAWPT